MALKITTLRSNFKKLNESIQQYIAEGKPTQEFLTKLVNLEREGVLKSCSDAWVLIFQVLPAAWIAKVTHRTATIISEFYFGVATAFATFVGWKFI